MTGELLNLLTKMNLLYKIDKVRDPRLPVNVTPQPEDPNLAAHKIRSQIGDENRSLRIFGSQVVLGRLLESPGKVRVFLLNLGTHSIFGLRVRLRGRFQESDAVTNLTQDGPFTEFSVPEVETFAVIDLATVPNL
jgi:hypothetical protein